MLGSIARGAGAVALGTAAGQGIVLAATPWLARQHTPAEFGALALMMTVSNIATAAACARYDLALPGARDDEAPALLRVALWVAGCSAIAALVVLLAAGRFGTWQPPFGAPWLVALCVLLVGAQQVAIGTATRERRFAEVGAIRFGQGGAFSLLGSLPSLSLVWAHALSFALAVPALLRRLRGRRVALAEVKRSAVEHRDFPALSLPGALLDVAGYSACVWLVVHFYGPHDAGQYSQVQRLVGAPLMLLSMSAAQVLLRLGVEAVADPDASIRLVRRLTLALAALAGALIGATALLGEPVLGWLLGPQWRVDPSFTVPIVFAVTVRACVSPLSTLLVPLRRFGVALRWQALYFVTSLGVLGAAAAHFDSIGQFVVFYAVHEAVLYGLYWLLIVKALRQTPCAASSA